mmetsp:Transcript_25766/g.80937  ORF Transcript_25766/g.80937 Transcript_25766/m.80937 type:complete len:479 (+) Transcript_25766:203-1639(+)
MRPSLRRETADMVRAPPSRSAKDIVGCSSSPLAAFCGVGLARMRRLSCPGDCGRACGSVWASSDRSFARRFRKAGIRSMMAFLTRSWTSIGSSLESSSAAASAMVAPVMAASVLTSCGSNSMRWKMARRGLLSSSSVAGTSSVTRPRSRTSASMTWGVGRSEWAICRSTRPRRIHAGVNRGPSPSGCRASAAQAQRQRLSSTSRPSTGEIPPPSLESGAPRFRTERKCVALSASSKRSCTCSTMSTSSGIVAPLARFLAGCDGSPDFPAAAASKASRTAVAWASVSASPTWASIVSGRLGGAGSAAAAASAGWPSAASPPSGSFGSAAATSSWPSAAWSWPAGGARRCSRCSATRMARPRKRGQTCAAGPSSLGSEVAMAFRRSPSPAARDLEKAEVVSSMICFSVSACSGRTTPRVAGSRKTASTTVSAPAVSSAAGCRCRSLAVAARRRSQAGSRAPPRMPHRAAACMSAVIRAGA